MGHNTCQTHLHWTSLSALSGRGARLVAHFHATTSPRILHPLLHRIRLALQGCHAVQQLWLRLLSGRRRGRRGGGRGGGGGLCLSLAEGCPSCLEGAKLVQAHGRGVLWRCCRAAGGLVTCVPRARTISLEVGKVQAPPVEGNLPGGVMNSTGFRASDHLRREIYD